MSLDNFVGRVGVERSAERPQRQPEQLHASVDFSQKIDMMSAIRSWPAGIEIVVLTLTWIWPHRLLDTPIEVMGYSERQLDDLELKRLATFEQPQAVIA